MSLSQQCIGHQTFEEESTEKQNISFNFKWLGRLEMQSLLWTSWALGCRALTFPFCFCMFDRLWWGAALSKWRDISLEYSMIFRSSLPSVPTLWGERVPPAGGEPSHLDCWERTGPLTCTFRALTQTTQTTVETTSIVMVGPRRPEGRLCGQIINPGWMGSLIPMVW